MLAVSGRHPCPPWSTRRARRNPPRRSRGARRDGRVLRRRSRRCGAPRRDDRAGLGRRSRAKNGRAVHFLHAVEGGAPRRQARERHAETRVGRRRGAARADLPRRFRIGGVRSRRGKENALRGFAGTKFFGAPECFRGARRTTRQERRVVSRRHAPRASRRDARRRATSTRRGARYKTKLDPRVDATRRRYPDARSPAMRARRFVVAANARWTVRMCVWTRASPSRRRSQRVLAGDEIDARV